MNPDPGFKVTAVLKGAYFVKSFRVTQVCQRQLSFLVMVSAS